MERPFDTLFSLDQWEGEFERALTGEELAQLHQPGGEAMMIQERARDGYPAIIIIPEVPDLPAGSLYWAITPRLLSAHQPRHYYVRLGDTAYQIDGHWVFGHSQFVATMGHSHPAAPGGHVHTGLISPLKLTILAAVIMQRAAAIVAQRQWLTQILTVNDEAERQADLRALLDEGWGIIEFTHTPAEEGMSLLNFRGIAGLPVFEVYWHRVVGQCVIDRVERPPAPTSRPAEFHRGAVRSRHAMDASVPQELVIIELCTMYMERMMSPVSA